MWHVEKTDLKTMWGFFNRKDKLLLLFHLLTESQKAEALHECYAYIWSYLIWILNLQCQKIWNIMFNDFFEAHSSCFSWIANSLHYSEYSLHIWKSTTRSLIIVYIDHNNLYITISIIYFIVYTLSISYHYRDSIYTLYTYFPSNDQISILLS